MTDAANNDNGNGKITLAVLGFKMDVLLGEIKKLQDCQTLQGNKVQALELGQQKREQQIMGINEDIDELRSEIKDNRQKSWWTQGVASAVTFAASVFTALYGGRP